MEYVIVMESIMSRKFKVELLNIEKDVISMYKGGKTLQYMVNYFDGCGIKITKMSLNRYINSLEHRDIVRKKFKNGVEVITIQLNGYSVVITKT